MTRSVALLVLLFLYAVDEYACADELWSTTLKGRVQLAGSIVDSACSIRVGNDRQTIAFKPTALSGLINGDGSSQQPLKIYVSHCTTSDIQGSQPPSQRFKLAFEGETSGKYFGIQGGAQGIALQIKDEHGKLVSPGMLLDQSTPSADTQMLNYSLTLIGSGHALEAGDYHATIKLSIQHF